MVLGSIRGSGKHYEEPVEKAERYIQTTTRFYEILGKRRMM